jgi:hypothetical protein
MSLDEQPVLPIKPPDLNRLKKEHDLLVARKIPSGIIRIFNEEIVANSNGRGVSYVKQPVIVARIVKELNIPSADIFANKWLDVEILFKEAGWKVSYDKPAYCESYDASWTFQEKV